MYNFSIILLAITSITILPLYALDKCSTGMKIGDNCLLSEEASQNNTSFNKVSKNLPSAISDLDNENKTFFDDLSEEKEKQINKGGLHASKRLVGAGGISSAEERNAEGSHDKNNGESKNNISPNKRSKEKSDKIRILTVNEGCRFKWFSAAKYNSAYFNNSTAKLCNIPSSKAYPNKVIPVINGKDDTSSRNNSFVSKWKLSNYIVKNKDYNALNPFGSKNEYVECNVFIIDLHKGKNNNSAYDKNFAIPKGSFDNLSTYPKNEYDCSTVF